MQNDKKAPKEHIRIIVENGEATIWEKGKLSWKDIMKIAGEDIKDSTYVLNIDIYKMGDLVKKEELRYKEEMNLSTYLSENKLYEFRIGLTSDGSVS